MQGSRKAAEQILGKRSRKRKESAASAGKRRGNNALRRRGGACGQLRAKYIETKKTGGADAGLPKSCGAGLWEEEPQA